MNGIENATFDLQDAKFSVDTAIDLLSTLERPQGAQDLSEVVRSLMEVKTTLNANLERLEQVNTAESSIEMHAGH